MTLQPGSLLQGGKYKIEQMLGQGGFGITYLGVQTGLNRRVAIKEFFMKEYCNRDHITSQVHVATDGSRELVERYRQKFLKEAQTIAVFEHPCIVKIYDIFEENETAYYVMEYIGNGSLKDKVDREGKLPEPLALKYIRQVADALDYVHGRNIVHLDIKPSNILLRSNDMPVLIDFGISKRYDETGSQTSSTPVGISKGYAPLEQYQQGGVENFQPATDIYSLGATLYFLLTGKQPPEATVVYNDGLPAFPSSVSLSVAEAVRIAMNPKVKERPQRIGKFLDLFKVEYQETENETKSLIAQNTFSGHANNKQSNTLRKVGGSLLILVLGAFWIIFSAFFLIEWEERYKENKEPFYLFMFFVHLLGVSVGAWIFRIWSLKKIETSKSFSWLVAFSFIFTFGMLDCIMTFSESIFTNPLFWIVIIWGAVALIKTWCSVKNELPLPMFYKKNQWTVLPLLGMCVFMEFFRLIEILKAVF